ALTEEHHEEKLDRPSGTAIHIANNIIIKNTDLKNKWSVTLPPAGERMDAKTLYITVSRFGNEYGYHGVKISDGSQTIKISHESNSREHFVRGALSVAPWLLTQERGHLLTMQDYLKTKN
ncbi:MAG: hypothetical protein FWG18_03290, partial [Alphaproteobacteria bacterium]|nr:hypothetical protein [Alphaproteobacteria bacterium]